MIDFGYGVELDALCMSDMEKCRLWRNDNRIWKWCRQNDLISDIAQSNWFERQNMDPSIHMYKILNFGEHVGVCGLTSHDYINRSAEFSLYIAPDFHGNGLGRKSLITLVSHGFKNLGLHSIWGETYDHNPAFGMFISLGFSLDGTRRDLYFREGKFIDAKIVSVLENEWRF